jgi:hypothetical protein
MVARPEVTGVGRLIHPVGTHPQPQRVGGAHVITGRRREPTWAACPTAMETAVIIHRLSSPHAQRTLVNFRAVGAAYPRAAAVRELDVKHRDPGGLFTAHETKGEIGVST